MKKIAVALLSLGLILHGGVLTASTAPFRETITVLEVVDGDTIKATVDEEIESIRLIGINTPELSGEDSCYGEEARAYLERLIEGKQVTIEKDKKLKNRDSFGRLLRYASLEKLDVGTDLLKKGYARAYMTDGIAKKKLYTKFELLAEKSNKGLWKACDTEETSVPETTGDCLIKGNISSSTGEKIYHVPSGAFYKKTVIGDIPGEKCFQTESEAVDAGWRKSKK